MAAAIGGNGEFGGGGRGDRMNHGMCMPQGPPGRLFDDEIRRGAGCRHSQSAPGALEPT
jgi:hypothetical protein